MRTILGILLGVVGIGYAYSNARPNVLFIAVDDLRPALGAYGDENALTPRIDALGESGTVFLNASCQFPVCGPSRASILTGLKPESTGVLNLKTRMRDVHPDILTLPQYFKENGYVTAGVGKIFDPRCVDGRKHGDEISWTLPYNEGPDGAVPLVDGLRQAWAVFDEPDDAFMDGRIASAGIETLGKLAAKDEPFFLAVGFKKPHLPFVAPKRHWDRYDSSQFELASFQEKAYGNSGYGFWNSNETRGYDGVPDEGEIPEDVQRNLIHGYYACVSWVDELVGRLLDALEASGEADNTVIVLWGDHGFHLGDYGLWGKHTPFENAMRVPLMIVDPRVGRAHKTSSPAEFSDVFPTLCELAGLEIPSQLQGKSLLGVLHDSNEQPRPGAIGIYKSRGAYGYSIRTERYRYIEWVNTKTAKVVGKDLFDFDVDPLGKRSLAEKRAYRKVVAELSSLLYEDAKGWTLLERSLAERDR